MNITLDMLKHRREVQFSLGVQNYLLSILGGGALQMHGIADLVDTSDFISFCIPPEYAACIDTEGSIVKCAITQCRLKRVNDTIMCQQCFQLNDASVLYVNTVSNILLAVEAHYTHRVNVGTSSIYNLEQAVSAFRHIVGESYNVC